MPLSLDTLRVGRRYRLRNYGEEHVFQVLEVLEEQDFRVKDMHTLDVYLLSDLIRYGRSKDFDLEEV